MVGIEILSFAPDAESVISVAIFLMLIAQVLLTFHLWRVRGSMKDLYEHYGKMGVAAETAFDFIRERGLVEDFEEYLRNLTEDLREKYGDAPAEL